MAAINRAGETPSFGLVQCQQPFKLHPAAVAFCNPHVRVRSKGMQNMLTLVVSSEQVCRAFSMSSNMPQHIGHSLHIGCTLVESVPDDGQ